MFTIRKIDFKITFELLKKSPKDIAAFAKSSKGGLKPLSALSDRLSKSRDFIQGFKSLLSHE